MTRFQQYAILLIAVWLLLVVVRFRRSKVALTAGLLVLGLYTLGAVLRGNVSLAALGLSTPASWLFTIGLALAWLVLMLAYSPLADKLATRWIAQPPNLEPFRVLQESRIKLLIGVVVAWILGGFLEELIARGIVLQSLRALLLPWVMAPIATSLAILVAAVGAGIMHLYQGPRAAIITTQLSFLFGLLFVISGYNLWTAVVCHGMYDTVAFIRFANRTSKYSTVRAASD